MLLGFVAETASSCRRGNSVDIRSMNVTSMNVTFQSGAMGYPISAQKMDVCRMGFPAVTTLTAIKRDIITMTNSAGRFLVKVQGMHLRIAIKKSIPREMI